MARAVSAIRSNKRKKSIGARNAQLPVSIAKTFLSALRRINSGNEADMLPRARAISTSAYIPKRCKIRVTIDAVVRRSAIVRDTPRSSAMHCHYISMSPLLQFLGAGLRLQLMGNEPLEGGKRERRVYG